MIRRWFSNFIKNNISKFKDLGIKLIIVAIVVFIATIMLSSFRSTTSKEDNRNNETYNPTQTIIKGSNVSKEQYKENLNTINKFLEYCNSGKIKEAYNLISDECKYNLYQTVEVFKNNYYDYIFKEKRNYNLQAWISNSNYTIYKIRYSTDMLSTGVYEEDNIYQDYITLIKKAGKEEISIGSFVTSEEINKITETNEIEARVIKKNVYLEYEEYEIEIRNNTSKIILMDTLEGSQNIKLLGSSGAYSAMTNKIFTSNMKINPKSINRINITFKKPCSSSNKSEYIQFLNVIRDFDSYNLNSEDYNEAFSIKVRI